MNAKQVIEQAKELLKAAKENPEQFQELEKARSKDQKGVHNAHFGAAAESGTSAVGAHFAPGGASPKTNAWAKDKHKEKLSELKDMPKPNLPKSEMDKCGEGMPMKKDDMPHAPNSPQDKAHDVAEHDDSLVHAMKILDTPEKQQKMLAHLRTLHDPDQQRSEANREAGQAPAEKENDMSAMGKAEMIKAAKELLELAKNEPAKFEELTKGLPQSQAAANATDQAVVKAAPAMAPAPAAPKAAAPAAPAKKPAGMRMTKDEIKADLAKPWAPKHNKNLKGC